MSNISGYIFVKKGKNKGNKPIKEPFMEDKKINEETLNKIYRNAHIALQSISNVLEEAEDEKMKAEQGKYRHLHHDGSGHRAGS